MKKLVLIAMIASLVPVICLAAEAAAAERAGNRTIEINGTNESLMWHVDQGSQKQEHLSGIDFFRYHSKNRIYKAIDKVCGLRTEVNIDDINAGNFVAASNYKRGKGGASRTAVILGTTDERCVTRLLVAVARRQWGNLKI